MKIKRTDIYNQKISIPVILWGENSNKLLIAVHGDMSHKEDVVINLSAQNAIDKNYMVVSFDLPEHGERINDNYECNPQNCISDLLAVYDYAKSLASEIHLFACSVGAYFSLLAYHELNIKNTSFLSPVVNMKRIIQNMMTGFQVSERRLETEKRIFLPTGKTLDWDYYTYVKQHPINFNWNSRVRILYGSEDILSEKKEVEAFSKRYNAELTILNGSEHYFHTPKQMMFLETWLKDNL